MLYQQPWRGLEGQAAFYSQIVQMNQRFTDEIVRSNRDTGRCRSPWILVLQGERLASLIHASDLVRVPNSGPLVQEDAPEAIVSALSLSDLAINHKLQLPDIEGLKTATSNLPESRMDNSASGTLRRAQIDPAYRHYAKMVTSCETLDLQGARLKWYEVARAETPVPESIRILATSFPDAGGR